MSTDNVAIRVENLTKVYKLYDKPVDRLKESLHPFRKTYHREFYALKDVSFEIKKGETVGIIGKNGSGKSTLLKIITGVLTPTSGMVQVNGKVSALLELGAGFNPEMTGIENIYLNGTIMGYTKEEMDTKIDDILSFADIGDFVCQPVKSYSSGMFARLAFAVSINVDPDILIVDEALAVGDLRFQLKCMDKFTEFREKGKTILFVTHDINSVKRFCSSCIWINEGEVQAAGNTDEITDLYLDYLKVSETEDSLTASIFTQNQLEEIKINDVEIDDVEIAELKSIKIMDAYGNESKVFQHNEEMIVQIDYVVADETIEDAVLGVAIRSVDHVYICGLNTLLDEVKVPWKYGKNRFYLKYKNMNLIGGSYYIDVAIFERNATVPIEYKSKVASFTVRSKYIGEGIVVLEHLWEA